MKIKNVTKKVGNQLKKTGEGVGRFIKKHQGEIAAMAIGLLAGGALVYSGQRKFRTENAQLKGTLKTYRGIASTDYYAYSAKKDAVIHVSNADDSLMGVSELINAAMDQGVQLEPGTSLTEDWLQIESIPSEEVDGFELTDDGKWDIKRTGE